MSRTYLPCLGTLCLLSISSLLGCGQSERVYPLNTEVARSSVEQAMQAWVDGKTPKDLQPKIIVGDTSWDNGKKLVSFEILKDGESSHGSNLHVSVKRKFNGKGKSADSNVTYIVSTSPVVTIFPQ